MLGVEFPLPDYSQLTLSMVLLYTIAGVFGALVRVAWLDKPLRGFYRDADGGIRMGFFAEVIIGVAVAIAVDGHPVRAGMAAVFAPFILDMIKTTIVDKGPELAQVILRKRIEDDSTENTDSEAEE